MKKQEPIAVLAGARTPFAKAFTQLSDLSAVDLGVSAVREAAKRAGIPLNKVDEVVLGNVSGPPDSANIARVISLRAGVPVDRVAHTVNRNCASGMESIISGWQSIVSGRAKTVVVGGTESMSQVPLLYSPDAAAIWMRLGRAKSLWQRLRAVSRFRPRHFKPIAGLELGLTDPVSGLNMGETAELLADDFSISRQTQDQFALESHLRAEEAQTHCFLSGEIVPFEKTDGSVVEKDNGPRHGQSLEQLARLRPIFRQNGSVTAGNSCPLTDGAAALVLTSDENANGFDARPLGYITAYAIAGCAPDRMGLGPVFATTKLLDQTGYRLTDFDLFEINEAFSAQVLACCQAFESSQFANEHLGRREALGTIPRDKLNIHGGAIALGHPVGTTGTRMILTLLRSLRATGKQRGLATLCVGGGQGVAMVVQPELGDEPKERTER